MVSEMTSNTSNTLPDKPSELLRLALADLRKAEKDPRYAIDMDTWHDPFYDVEAKVHTDEPTAVCQVCLAGAVMAFSLGADPLVSVYPWELGHETDLRLELLNELREGCVKTAVAVYLKYSSDRDVTDAFCQDKGLPSYVEMPEYDVYDPDPFHTAAGALADTLERAGL